MSDEVESMNAVRNGVEGRWEWFGPDEKSELERMRGKNERLRKLQEGFEDRLRRIEEAARFAYEFLGVLHDPNKESSVPGRTTCNVCRALDALRAVLSEEA